MSWLDGLNQLSPDSSPSNGLNDPNFDLSFPLNAAELQRQLDAWTNVSFAIDPPAKRPDFDGDDDYIRKTKNASATANSSGLDFNFNLDTTTIDPSLSLEPRHVHRSNSTSSDHSSTPTSGAGHDGLHHPLAFANMLGLPAQREANRSARDARAHSIQPQTTALFHQPLSATYPMSVPTSAAHSGLSAGADPFLGLLPLPTVTAATAAPTAIQQASPQQQTVTSLPAPPSRAQQAAASKSRARNTSSNKNANNDATNGEGQTGAAARRASTGAAAPRNNTAAKSGVGTNSAAPQTAPVWNQIQQQNDQPLADPVAEAARQEELNRVAVEEDKRRRNTAASARFRIKKKQREQALEASATTLRDRVAELEKEVENLKQENGWLRGLVVEKTNTAPGTMPATEPTPGASTEVAIGRKRAREDEDDADDYTQ